MRPIVGITMGDPSGIGPEVLLKALSDKSLYEICRPVVFGDAGVLLRTRGRPADLRIREIDHPREALGTFGQVEIIPLSSLPDEATFPGRPGIQGGKAMVQYILRAVESALEREIEAVVTCPISKALMQKAGYDFEGHTPLIAQLTRTENYVMMLAGENLRVSLVTVHCALKDVPALLDIEAVYKTIAITGAALEQDFGIPSPRLAVAALNPHGGEAGLFGREESEIILPAVNKARTRGIRAEGPYPPDTLFYKARLERFDAVVAMYHDQGLIPLKLLHFSDAVNVTLGLPIIRTSVDHGTAYDIAGKDMADPSSLKAALRMAVEMARHREARRRRNRDPLATD
ncbi:MAG: 4-hydroxythreonine-4-phosphate dehydrogenase PdxA [Deltaproteobacteria bacterium]|nr:4-hydroxythreonine-4-phosphate dehydrogenase PdxA [Deltaproteobacteria bacterium]